MGGEGYALVNDFLFRISGDAIIGSDQRSGGLETEVYGGMGFLHFGYTVINRDNLKVFPMLGFGAGGMELQIMQNGDVSINEIVNNPGRQIDLEINNLMFDLALGIDAIHFLSISKEGKPGLGFKTGIRLGYTLGLDNNDWIFGGGEVSGAPNFGMNIFYVKLILGGHGFIMKD